ncbi:hypothetical protein MY4824_000780 [Beauveria thailandica]
MPALAAVATAASPTGTACPVDCRRRDRPKLVLMPRAASELALPNGQGLELTTRPKPAQLRAYRKLMRIRGFHDDYLRRREIFPSPGLDPEGHQLQRLIIDSLRCYDDHSYLPDIVSDPLVSVSAVHRISKTQCALEAAAHVPGCKYAFRQNRLLSVRHPLVPVVFRHQQRMAGALASMVADPALCEHRDVLEAITTMMLCELLDDIAAFSPAVWLDERTLQLAKVFGSRTKQAESGSTRSALLDLVQSFQMATILYAIRTLFLDHDDFSSESGILDLQQVEAAAIEALGASLRRIWEMEHASPDWFGKFTVWPLFMLGMSIDPVVEPEETTYFICRSLQRLGHHIRAMTYKDAIWALQHTWERSEKVERSSWLGELPLDVLPGLFFM